MLTIFSVPKPFAGQTGIIQRNAIQSWLRLDPACEIMLCGNESGIEETAMAFGTKWIPSIACNEYGTPLLDSVFDQVEQKASHRLLCYLNTDVILLSDFLKAVRHLRFRRFVMVGQRWDLEIIHPLDFNRPDWEEQLLSFTRKHGRLHPPAGSDYFVFPKHRGLGELPPFAVGRPAWDNWFIYRARQLGIPVVDATKVVTVIHQNHDYAHISESIDRRREGPEAERNRQLAGGWNHVFTLLDATHLVTAKGVSPAFGSKYLKRRWRTLPILVPAARPVLKMIERIGDRLRLLPHLMNSK